MIWSVCVCVYVVVWAILCTLYRNISLLLLHVYIFLNDMFSFFHARAVCVVRRARMSSHLLFLRAEPSKSFSRSIEYSSGTIVLCSSYLYLIASSLLFCMRKLCISSSFPLRFFQFDYFMLFRLIHFPCNLMNVSLFLHGF